MIYVLDTNSLCVLKNFYPTTFPGLWVRIDALVASGEFISVEEAYGELTKRVDSEHLLQWVERNKAIFTPPTEKEMDFVAGIFAVQHFQQLVSQDALLRGGLVADPWIIARAHSAGGCVVTEEKLKPNAAKIPNVCDHFQIPWTNVEGLFQLQGWRY